MSQSTMSRTWPSKRYEPAGYCIYCGATEGRFTDEHIIPYALGGNFVLPEASCDECSNITKRFEGFCTRPMLGPLRIRLRIQTRRKKQRPKTIDTLLIHPDGTQEMLAVPPEKYPVTCIGFKFKSPGIMLGEQPSAQFEGELVVRQDEEAMGKFIPKDGTKVKLGTFNQAEFARLLAKVAHSYAVAEAATIGLKFKQFLPDIILGRSDKFPYFIGGDIDPVVQEPYFHQLHFKRCEAASRHLFFVTVHLFGFMGMPRYHVVVGEPQGCND